MLLKELEYMRYGLDGELMPVSDSKGEWPLRTGEGHTTDAA